MSCLGVCDSPSPGFTEEGGAVLRHSDGATSSPKYWLAGPCAHCPLGKRRAYQCPTLESGGLPAEPIDKRVGSAAVAAAQVQGAAPFSTPCLWSCQVHNAIFQTFIEPWIRHQCLTQQKRRSTESSVKDSGLRSDATTAATSGTPNTITRLLPNRC